MADNPTADKLLAWCRARSRNLLVIKRDSPEWQSWRLWRLDHGLGVGFMDRQEKWTVPDEFPPDDLDRALAAALAATNAGKAKALRNKPAMKAIEARPNPGDGD